MLGKGGCSSDADILHYVEMADDPLSLASRSLKVLVLGDSGTAEHCMGAVVVRLRRLAFALPSACLHAERMSGY